MDWILTSMLSKGITVSKTLNDTAYFLFFDISIYTFL